MSAWRGGLTGLGGVLALALAGCAAGPDYQRPEATVAGQWRTEPGWSAGQPQDGALKGAWWRAFADATLDALEEAAQENSQTLRIAQARVDQARAQANVADSAFFPRLGLQGGAGRNRTSADRPLSNYAVPNASVLQNDFNGAFTVSYEADLFGRVRRQAQAAAAGTDQARADFENTRLILGAELAADYFALRETDAESDTLQRTLAAQGKVLDFIAARHELGAASALDLEQQRALVAATRTQLALLADQRSRYEHAIATLVGKPAPEFSLPAVPSLVAPPAIPLVTPSALLERRPDIAAAERAMAAANAQIGVARSAFFPAVMLSGQYGSDSNQLAHLFSAPSLLWSLGVSATQTLFDAGRTRATVAFAEAGYQQAVAAYRQTVLVAMQEVQDGLSGSAHLAEALASAKSAADSSASALSLSGDRYAVGVANHLELLLAETNYLGYQRQYVQLQGQQLLNAVRLVKALGGGWQLPLAAQEQRQPGSDKSPGPDGG